MRIVYEEPSRLPLARQRYEIVERKGLGHPDTICDSVMDAVSVALCQEYVRVAGHILHHNLDKSLLIAGRTVKQCGGGQVLQPMELIMGDRATDHFHETAIPVQDLAIATAKQWFRAHLPHLDPDSHIRFRPAMAPGSAELTDIFARGGVVLAANDTSGAVGHAPYTPLERLVLDLEAYLNGPQFKSAFPDTGQDVKIMARRVEAQVDLTVAMPFLAQRIDSVATYFARKAQATEAMLNFIRQTQIFDEVQVTLNSLDRVERGEDGIYLSLTGTSAEDADSGQVGRGNRVSGVIAFHRPAGAEAAAGKNPVSHVGKIYNVLAHQLAQEILDETEGLEAVSIWIVSQIGQPIDAPALVHVQLTPKEGVTSRSLQEGIGTRVRARFAAIGEFCQALANGRYPVC
jgi:S-adenosylmethionine synthetase